MLLLCALAGRRCAADTSILARRVVYHNVFWPRHGLQGLVCLSDGHPLDSFTSLSTALISPAHAWSAQQVAWEREGRRRDVWESLRRHRRL